MESKVGKYQNELEHNKRENEQVKPESIKIWEQLSECETRLEIVKKKREGRI